MSLFAENVAGGPGNEPLLKFRAGKMFTSPVDGGPKLKVSPDKRKGTILLTKEVDGMMHFKWMDRTAGKVEDVSHPPCACARVLSLGRFSILSPCWSECIELC